eukprot:6208157-Pleurochrysis_carterae.AAC.3
MAKQDQTEKKRKQTSYDKVLCRCTKIVCGVQTQSSSLQNYGQLVHAIDLSTQVSAPSHPAAPPLPLRESLFAQRCACACVRACGHAQRAERRAQPPPPPNATSAQYETRRRFLRKQGRCSWW